MRARVVNPKWIDGVMRHGYMGAFEIAATVDYLRLRGDRTPGESFDFADEATWVTIGYASS